MHSGIAFLTGIPEIALDEKSDEHTKLARAVERVARHYDIPALDPITHDWLMLFKTLALIYGSRVLAYNMRVAGDRATPVKPAPSAVNQPSGAAPAPPKPQAPAPQQSTPNGARVPVTIQGDTIRAAPIPGLPDVVLDIPVNQPTMPWKN